MTPQWTQPFGQEELPPSAHLGRMVQGDGWINPSLAKIQRDTNWDPGTQQVFDSPHNALDGFLVIYFRNWGNSMTQHSNMCQYPNDSTMEGIWELCVVVPPRSGVTPAGLY